MGIRSMLSRRRIAHALDRSVAARATRGLRKPSVRGAADAAVAAMESLEGRTLFAVNYAIVDLGGTAGSEARGINVNGQAAGVSGEPSHAVRFNATGGPVDLGTFGGGESQAFGINDSGVVVGEAFTEAVGEEGISFRHAFISGPAGTAKTDIHPENANEESRATAVNNSGAAVGYTFTEGAPDSERAFVYANGQATDVGVLGGANSYSKAFAINNGGSIAGQSLTAGGVPHAFLRLANATTLTDLGAFNDDPALGSFSNALGINDRNDVVGVSGFTAATEHAFLYTGGEMTDLGVLEGTANSRANDINNRGDIVGASAADTQYTDGRAFLFTGGEMIDLNTLVPANSGWVLQEAFSINRDGQIVGVGTQNGVRKAFRLDPQDDPITPPVDATPPTGAVKVANVSAAGGTSFTVTVTYADETNVDRDTIGVGDIEVRRAGNGNGNNAGAPLTVTGVTVAPDADGKSLVATYTVTPPGGTWNAEDAGTYNVTVKAGEVKDTAGNAVVNAAGSFVAAFAVQATGPTTTIAPIANVTAAGGMTYDVVVTYTDDVAVDRESIGTDDLTVTPPGNLTVVFRPQSVTISPDGGDAATLTATYTFNAGHAGSDGWDSTDNGTYLIIGGGSSVVDTEGNAGGVARATFEANIGAPAQTIDPTFNSGNPVNTQFVAEALAADTDGRIVVAGHQGGAGDTMRAVLKRYNADGSLDASFGDGGTLVSPDGQDDAYYAVAIDETGRIIAAGSFGGDFAVSRFKTNGAADNKFGTRGRITTDFGDAAAPTADVAYSFALAPDGSIVAAGGSAGRFAIAKYTAGGALDTTFQSGRILIDPSDGGDVLGSVAITPDGKIVGAGTSGSRTSVVRLNGDGSTDATFNGGAVRNIDALAVRTDLGMTDRTVGLGVQGDNRIVVANRTAGNDFGIARLNLDGSLDAGFSSDGLMSVDFGGDDDADAVQVQGTGEIFIIGTTDAGGPRAAVAVLTPGGALDESFDADGKFTIEAGIVNQGRALHAGALVLRAFGGLQSNGRLVVGTRDAAPTVSSSPLRRLNVPGSGIVGSFGNVSGKSRKLAFLDANGTRITLTLKGGGSAQALYNGSEVDLVLTGTNDNSVLTLSGKGGDDNGRIVLSDIRSNGGLKSVVAKNADLRGTLYVEGNLGNVSFARVAGTIAAKGSIANVAIREDLAAGRILAGTDLGDDSVLGGTNGNADVYAAGNIGKVAIKGQVIASFVGAGIDPRNGTFGDAGDASAGGPSTIRSIAVKGNVDQASRFEAGAFGGIKAPAKLTPSSVDNPSGDVRFRIV